MIDGGREAMTEMRRLVDVLRPTDGDDGGELGAAAGPGRSAGLCDRLRAGGLPIDLHIDVAMEPARTAGITAYRIVQEALTNVVKHAGQVATRVDISGTASCLICGSPTARPAAAPRRAELGRPRPGRHPPPRRPVRRRGLRRPRTRRRLCSARHAPASESPDEQDPRPDRRRPAADAAGIRYDPRRAARHHVVGEAGTGTTRGERKHAPSTPT